MNDYLDSLKQKLQENLELERKTFISKEKSDLTKMFSDLTKELEQTKQEVKDELLLI